MTALKEDCLSIKTYNKENFEFVKPIEDKGNASVKSKSKKKGTKFTVKQKVSLCMLATVEFTSYCSMSIMAPFYPKEAQAKGMSEATTGFVFSFYALFVFLSSPVFGKLLPKFGVKFLFIFGILLSGTCNIFFGGLQYVENATLFTVLSFVIRGAEAIGASAYSTAGYVLVINIFPKHGGVVRGILETFVGLGMSAGPAIGGLLFTIGGFGLPFYVVGSISIIIAPLNIFVFPPSKEYKVEVKSGSFSKIIKLPSVIITCSVIVVVSATWGFLDPTLEPHLRKFDLSPGNVGLIFLLLSAMYGIFSPAWGFLSDKIKNYWYLMSLGLLFNSLCLLAIGPSPYLSFVQGSILLNIIALSALGVFVAMAVMPTYQGILDSALEGGFSDSLGTHSIVAGLWSSAYSLGEMLGPAMGGTLLQEWGFPKASTCVALLNFIFALISGAYFATRKQRIVICDIKDKARDSNEQFTKTDNEFGVFTIEKRLVNNKSFNM